MTETGFAQQQDEVLSDAGKKELLDKIGALTHHNIECDKRLAAVEQALEEEVDRSRRLYRENSKLIAILDRLSERL